MFDGLAKLISSTLGRRKQEFTGRELVNLRRAARLPVRLPLKAYIYGTELEMAGSKYLIALHGYTRDVSSIGLGFVLLNAEINHLDLKRQYPRMKIVLEVPRSPVEIFATTVHYKPLREAGSDDGCLVGARITRLSQSHRNSLNNHLSSLDQEYFI